MPEKVDKYILIVMGISALLVGLAKTLTEKDKLSFREFVIKITVAGISGVFFGVIGCWILGEHIYAVTAISGVGAYLGMEGIRHISEKISDFIDRKFK